MTTRLLVAMLCKTILYLEQNKKLREAFPHFILFFIKFPHLSPFLFYFIFFNYKPPSHADKLSPRPVVQNVTSDILVPEVMKLIWWSVSDMANKQSPYWSSSTGSAALLCNALFCIVKDHELLPQGTNAT